MESRASIIILTKNGLILVENKVDNTLVLPGGRIETTDSSPMAAARRELYEETSLRLCLEKFNERIIDKRYIYFYKKSNPTTY
jgi:8-oxo-dGTP pyrophosphatase MutT (NUDIX family)